MNRLFLFVVQFSVALTAIASTAQAEPIGFTSALRISDTIDSAMGTADFDHIYLQTADRKYTARVTCEGAIVGTPVLKVVVSAGDTFVYKGSRSIDIPQKSNKDCKQSYLAIQKTSLEMPFPIDLRYAR